MYSVVQRYALNSVHSEALQRDVREGFVQSLPLLPGFVAYYWLEGGTETAAALSIFEDQACAEAFLQHVRAFDEQHAAFFATAPEVICGEVKAFVACGL